jgi:hypothetical protein
MEAIGWLSTNLGSLVQAVTMFVGAFALVATLTPNTSDDRIVKFLLDLTNFFGANIGKASNDPAKP